MNGDVTDDDSELGQTPGGPPPGPQPPAGPPGAGGGFLASMARNQMGPQISAPGPGNMADAMTKIQQAIGILQQALPGLPLGQKLHTDVTRSIGNLSRHLGGQAGMGPAAGVQKTSLMDQLRDTIRNQMLQRVLGQQGQARPGAGAGGPAGPQPPGGPPPMPSTPFPGS
jgi:hypothetical protein